MKVERLPSPRIKAEADDLASSPYLEEDDVYEDAGDLDFTNAQQQIWLNHIPASLWEALSTIADDDELDIGTIRMELQGSDTKRVKHNDVLLLYIY